MAVATGCGGDRSRANDPRGISSSTSARPCRTRDGESKNHKKRKEGGMRKGAREQSLAPKELSHTVVTGR